MSRHSPALYTLMTEVHIGIQQGPETKQIAGQLHVWQDLRVPYCLGQSRGLEFHFRAWSPSMPLPNIHISWVPEDLQYLVMSPSKGSRQEDGSSSQQMWNAPPTSE